MATLPFSGFKITCRMRRGLSGEGPGEVGGRTEVGCCGRGLGCFGGQEWGWGVTRFLLGRSSTSAGPLPQRSSGKEAAAVQQVPTSTSPPALPLPPGLRGPAGSGADGGRGAGRLERVAGVPWLPQDPSLTFPSLGPCESPSGKSLCRWRRWSSCAAGTHAGGAGPPSTRTGAPGPRSALRARRGHSQDSASCRVSVPLGGPQTPS